MKPQQEPIPKEGEPQPSQPHPTQPPTQKEAEQKKQPAQKKGDQKKAAEKKEVELPTKEVPSGSRVGVGSLPGPNTEAGVATLPEEREGGKPYGSGYTGFEGAFSSPSSTFLPILSIPTPLPITSRP